MKELSTLFKEDLGRYATTTSHKIFLENCIDSIFKTLDDGLEREVELEKDRNTIRKVLLKCYKENIWYQYTEQKR